MPYFKWLKHFYMNSVKPVPKRNLVGKKCKKEKIVEFTDVKKKKKYSVILFIKVQNI